MAHAPLAPARPPAPAARLALLALLTLLALRPGVAAAQGAQLPPFVELRVPKPPTVASGDGASFLAYELHVTNFTPGTLTLRRVEVLGEDGRVVQALGDSALARALTRPGVSPAPPLLERAQVGGGLRAVVFLWVPVDARTPPARLRHRVSLAQGAGDSVRVHAVEGETVPVDADVAVIGPPLRGGGWLAANGPAPESGHRRGLLPVDGIAAVAQRFGIDFVRLNEAGATFTGDRERNESYRAHGAEALAVADGVVAATKDGIPENVPGVNSRAVPITLETVGGNYVVIDIGRGRYAFYAHLQPGSLRVKPGDRVTRGQVVGLVGNSGNSTEPHLHFHVSDAVAPLAAQGVPYVHETLQLEGRCRRLFAECTRHDPPLVRRREMPLANVIVRFPE